MQIHHLASRSPTFLKNGQQKGCEVLSLGVELAQALFESTFQIRTTLGLGQVPEVSKVLDVMLCSEGSAGEEAMIP